MVTGWISQAGAFKVEHVACPDYGLLDTNIGASRGVQHTTEGSLEAALAEFRHKFAPHFLLGRDSGRTRILQLIPLGRVSGALEHPAGTPATNGVVRAQIELADFSQHHPWVPQPLEVQHALSALYVALQHACGIPLRHVSNLNRDRGVFERNGGWFGHGDVPDQPAGHWDPGDLQYASIFALAHPAPAPPIRPTPKPLLLHPRTYTLVRRANGLVYSEALDRPT